MDIVRFPIPFVVGLIVNDPTFKLPIAVNPRNDVCESDTNDPEPVGVAKSKFGLPTGVDNEPTPAK